MPEDCITIVPDGLRAVIGQLSTPNADVGNAAVWIGSALSAVVAAEVGPLPRSRTATAVGAAVGGSVPALARIAQDLVAISAAMASAIARYESVDQSQAVLLGAS